MGLNLKMKLYAVSSKHCMIPRKWVMRGEIKMKQEREDGWNDIQQIIYIEMSLMNGLKYKNFQTFLAISFSALSLIFLFVFGLLCLAA